MLYIARTIAVYDLATDALVDTFYVRGISWDELKDIFDPADQDPEFEDIYDVDETRAALIREFVDGEMDLSKFAYQLHYETFETPD